MTHNLLAKTSHICGSQRKNTAIRGGLRTKRYGFSNGNLNSGHTDISICIFALDFIDYYLSR